MNNFKFLNNIETSIQGINDVLRQITFNSMFGGVGRNPIYHTLTYNSTIPSVFFGFSFEWAHDFYEEGLEHSTTYTFRGHPIDFQRWYGRLYNSVDQDEYLPRIMVIDELRTDNNGYTHIGGNITLSDEEYIEVDVKVYLVG